MDIDFVIGALTALALLGIAVLLVLGVLAMRKAWRAHLATQQQDETPDKQVQRPIWRPGDGGGE